MSFSMIGSRLCSRMDRNGPQRLTPIACLSIFMAVYTENFVELACHCEPKNTTRCEKTSSSKTQRTATQWTESAIYFGLAWLACNRTEKFPERRVECGYPKLATLVLLMVGVLLIWLAVRESPMTFVAPSEANLNNLNQTMTLATTMATVLFSWRKELWEVTHDIRRQVELVFRVARSWPTPPDTSPHSW